MTLCAVDTRAHECLCGHFRTVIGGGDRNQIVRRCRATRVAIGCDQRLRFDIRRSVRFPAIRQPLGQEGGSAVGHPLIGDAQQIGALEGPKPCKGIGCEE